MIQGNDAKMKIMVYRGLKQMIVASHRDAGGDGLW